MNQATHLVREASARRIAVPTQRLWPAAVTVFGLLLRLFRLGGWTPNEADMIRAAHQPLGEVWGYIVQADPYHPPLFPVFLHLWMGLGQSELVLRLLPVLLGTLSIWMLYRLGAYLCDRRTGLLAAFLLAISPLHIWHSQEVRMYALLFLLSLVALEALARIVKGGRPVHWVTYVIAAALSLYAETGALFVLAAHTVAVALLRLNRQGPRLWKWILVQGIVIALFLPWIPVLWGLLRPHGVVPASEPQFPYQQSEYGVPPAVANIGFVIATFASAFLPEATPLIKLAVVVVFGAVFMAGLRALRGRLIPFVLMLSLALIPLLIGVALSFKIGALRPRTVLPASAAYYVVVAVGLLNLIPRRVGYVALGVLVSLNIYSLDLMFLRNPEKAMAWDRVAEYVASSVRPGDGVIFVDGVWRLVFERYYPGARLPDSTGYPAPAELPSIREFVDGHAGLYLILKDPRTVDPEGVVRSYVRSVLRLETARQFPGGIAVEYYRR